MNKQILAAIFFFLMFSFNLEAQIAVSSFESANQDMTARVTKPILDQNGDKCALIKIRTTQKGFVFEGDMLGITQKLQKTGEIWLYIPAHARRLTIKHEYLGVLDNYLYPENIQEASVYIMELKTGEVKIIVQNQSIHKEWLVIESNPAGATVYINNEMQTSLTPFSKKLDIGNYTYRIEYKDYHADAGSFELLPGEKQNLQIYLKPAFGSLNINTTPEPGATILIDNQPIGQTTPFTIEKLASGKHEVRVMKDLYEIATQEAEIMDGQQTKVSIPMIPKYGEVKITTNPPSDIYINGEYIANAGYEGRLAIGSHSIEARMKHHYPDSKTIQITAGDKLEIDLKLQAKTGSLDVISNPMGAKIYIDGEYMDETPATIRELKEGEHSLKLIKEGFGTIVKNIEISENQTTEINEELPSGRLVSITSNPEGAALTIDGHAVGTTPYSGSISFGKHKLELKLDENILKEQIEITEKGNVNFAYSLGNTIDTRDGQRYKTVIIGNQTWFAENLNYKMENSWCYDNKAENCSKYGRLYTWDAAMQACPSGWHLASDDEWKKLEMYLGMTQTEANNAYNRVTEEGKKMKSIIGWKKNGNGTNSSGFNALPGGGRYYAGSFYYIGSSGYWWSSSESSSSHAWGRYLYYDYDQVTRSNDSKTYGQSVRCLKN